MEQAQGQKEGWRRKLLILFVLSTFGVGLIIGGGLIYLRNLPQLNSLSQFHPGTITQIYSQDDVVIGQLYQERRIPVRLNQIPKHLKQAILAAEDARFYEHEGIDPRGILRAFWADVKAGRIVEGGSTITQQLTRLLFLTPERSLSRKIQEAVLALLLESRYAKDEILELYLNQVYMGSGAYGVEAAAQTYFGKGVRKLTLAEAALLAGLPRSPNRYSPFNNIDLALSRRTHVLKRMVENGFIAQREAQQAQAAPPRLSQSHLGMRQAAHFVELIRLYLEEQYGGNAIYRQGLKVYTTLDHQLQRFALEAVRGGLRDLDKRLGFRPIDRSGQNGAHEVQIPASRLKSMKPGAYVRGTAVEVARDFIKVKVGDQLGLIRSGGFTSFNIKDPRQFIRAGDPIEVQVLAIHDQGNPRFEFALSQEPLVEGALVALEPQTGAIRTMVGGYDFYRSQFNRAVQAKRQPGSAFKPFIYTAAIDIGFNPDDTIVDAPVSYRLSGRQANWEPRNYTNQFYGQVSLRYALENSINVATIKLLEKVGTNRVINYAYAMGIRSQLKPNLSLALGTSDLSLLELTSAYGVLANRGVKAQPWFIRMVTDRNGKVLEQNHPITTEVLRPETAEVMTDMLRGVVLRGTGQIAKSIPHPMAAKTGTTDNAEDAWFVGYSANLAAGVWVGFDNHRSLGRNETGARAAGPIWVEFMRRALQSKEEQGFQEPAQAASPHGASNDGGAIVSTP